MQHLLSEEEFNEEAMRLLNLLFEAHDCPACNLNILTKSLHILFAVLEEDSRFGAQVHFRVLESNVAHLKEHLFRDGAFN